MTVMGVGREIPDITYEWSGIAEKTCDGTGKNLKNQTEYIMSSIYVRIQTECR